MLKIWLLYSLRMLIRIHFYLFGSSGKTLPKLTDLSSVLLSISGGIGDALMAQPMVRALRQINPRLKIDVLVSPATHILYAADEDVRKIWTVDKKFRKWVRLIAELRRQHYDAYIGKIPSNTLRKALLPYLAGIPIRIKHATWEKKYIDYDFLYHRIEPIAMEQHRVLCNLDLLKAFGSDIPVDVIAPHLEVNDETTRSALTVLARQNYTKNQLTVGFHPGCNPAARHKRWPAENYAALGDHLIKNYKAQIIIVGGQDELVEIHTLVSLMDTPPIVVAGKCTLLETAAIIKLCSFFVSNDSGIMHLAAALDVATLAVFGPTDERHIGPFGKKHRVIRNSNEVNSVSVQMLLSKLVESGWLN